MPSGLAQAKARVTASSRSAQSAMPAKPASSGPAPGRGAGRREGRGDPWPAVRESQNVGRFHPPLNAFRQGRVVDAAVLPADDQRDPLPGEGVECRQRGEHVGGQGVVDERDAADRADRGEAAWQRREVLRRGGEPLVVGDLAAQFLVACRRGECPQDGAGDQRVATVVPSREVQWSHPGRARLVGLADPRDRAARAGRRAPGAVRCRRWRRSGPRPAATSRKACRRSNARRRRATEGDRGAAR